MPDSPIPTISATDIERFFAAKSVQPKCPMCGTESWNVMEDEENKGVILYSLSTSGGVGNKFLSTLCLICGNCSTVWQIVRQPVEAWIRENPLEK